jgi:phage major head subunit gpT-like protein
MNVTSSAVLAASKALVGLFLQGHMDASAGSLVPTLCMPAKTKTGAAVFGWLGNLPGMKPFLNEMEKQSLHTNDWELKTVEYAAAYELKRLDMERDQLGIYTPLFKAAGERAAQHKDYMLGQRLKGAFTEKDYTGKNFCDTAKPWIKGAKPTFDNKITPALSLASFRTARRMIRNMKDPGGYPVCPGAKFDLIVSPDLEGTANDIIKADRLASGATNTEFGQATVRVFDYLSGNPWFLAVNNSALKPFINLDEIPLEFTARQDPNTDTAFLRRTWDFSAYAVNVINFGMPQLIVGSDATT